MAREPFLLEPWQMATVANLFGWRRDDGRRRYQEAFIFVPRKNGKTCLAAALLCYCLFEDGEPCAEIYGAAAEYHQASLCFEHVRGMIYQEPSLEERCKIYNGQAKSVQLPEDWSTYRVIASGGKNAHGYNTHFAVIDELHAHGSRELVDVLMTSTGARDQPMIVHITTSDYDRPSICNEKHDYACKVRDGVVDDLSFLPVIYEASPEDDWTDPDVWAKANPNLGVSCSLEYLERECKRAQEIPTYENTFKRLHLNIRTEQDVRWIPLSLWDECATEVDPKQLEGCKCFLGVDLAATSDVAAAVAYFPMDDGRDQVLAWFWVPKDEAEKREKRDKVPYVTWSRQGLLKMTPGNVIDYDVIRADIGDLAEKYKVERIGLDPWNSQQLETQLVGDGFDVVKFRQGFGSLSGPSKEFEKRVKGRRLRHGGNPILRWMASNVVVDMDAAGNIKPNKKKSSEKIDGIVSLVMAIGLQMASTSRDSVYEERGVRML
ncbi:MAG: terminase large subunit [Acidimicrobiia bacterium]|nr:terminase large subunit [Acidimicrobiia bacterium]